MWEWDVRVLDIQEGVEGDHAQSIDSKPARTRTSAADRFSLKEANERLSELTQRWRLWL
jgi:hypothetical protein